jgi:hypothetical protein
MFRAPKKWSAATFSNRRDNLLDLVQALGTDMRLSGRIDFSRIGLVGHSLGGYPELTRAGHFAWTDLTHRFAGSVFAYVVTLLTVTICGARASLLVRTPLQPVAIFARWLVPPEWRLRFDDRIPT